jgi:hypothetical protein
LPMTTMKPWERWKTLFIMRFLHDIVIWIPLNIYTWIRWMEKLRVYFKLCMFRVHARFGDVPFHPTIFFRCPSSCYCLNWDILQYQ